MTLAAPFQPPAAPPPGPPGAGPHSAPCTIFAVASALLSNVLLILHLVRAHFLLSLCTNAIQPAPAPAGFVSEPPPLELSAHDTSFERLFLEMAQDHDIYLSNTDLAMIESLEGTESFTYGKCGAQFKSAGICVELPKGTPMPRINPRTTISFRYGPKQRIVHLEPGKLTALGLSVLSWIVMPNRRDAAQFVDVMRHVKFRNSLVERLIHDVKDDLPSKQVVVPLGWLYCLDVPEEFLERHGRYGDMAATLGRKGADEIPSVPTQEKSFE